MVSSRPGCPDTHLIKWSDTFNCYRVSPGPPAVNWIEDLVMDSAATKVAALTDSPSYPNNYET